MNRFTLVATALLLCAPVFAASGDPQVKTDHPWYPGELSCSTFERLFKTQAELYKRVTGRSVDTDEDKALAAWYWRNLNYFHCTEGMPKYWTGTKARRGKNREYWWGLFANGYGLCGTTHAQWIGEMDRLLGHGRSRVVGVSGHNSFEVYLKGGAYGEGRWALMDHDVSTVIFAEDGSRLLSIPEVKAKLKTVANPKFKPERQRGWLVGGLHRKDPGTYKAYNTAEYGGGYAGPPPMLHLRKGESVRRYPKPGLADGKTFVFWGINYNKKIPGPSRWGTWVNQPEKMYKTKKTAGYKPGQGRFSNAVYTYKPDFKDGSYKEGVVDESDQHVTFEFNTPYAIGCTPVDVAAPKPDRWGIYKPGAKNGLVLNGKLSGKLKISTDYGKNWAEAEAADGVDLTDHVKGCRQYWLRFEKGAKAFADSGLTIRTVCQTNGALIPRLKDGETRITFQSTGHAVTSAGPTVAQAAARAVEGAMGDAKITLELATPRKEKAVRLHAAGWQASGSPPRAAKYQIEYSTDGGKTWKHVVKDWEVKRTKPEPRDFWSQSISYGEAGLEGVTGPVRVRFSNTGRRKYRRVEAHLAYEVANPGSTTVTFAWKEGEGELKTANKTFSHTAGKEDASWTLKTGTNVQTVWVEYKAE